MKVILVSLTSKYIHSPLASWYLKSSLDKCPGIDCEILDKTVNDDPHMIFADIISGDPSYVCFSVYVWNVDTVRKLVRDIKECRKNIRVVLGGPEVSFGLDGDDDLYKYSDCIIQGEGESALVRYITEGVKTEGYNVTEDLDLLESPYKPGFLEGMENRILYFESSRGCPFRCAYCLAPVSGRLRFFSAERVKSDLERILRHKIGVVKFTDRTFNADAERAKEILRFIIRCSPAFGFHFEIIAELLDEETISLLNGSPPGLFLLEAGVQSTNKASLQSVSRNSSFETAGRNLKKLMEGGRVHLHLDLIAGLPLEGMESFAASFNDVYDIKPHELQLGFLKFLKGAKITGMADHYGYAYRNYAPYEILYGSHLSCDDIFRLKKIEAVFNRIYNSKLFLRSLDKIERHIKKDAFGMYCHITDFFEKSGFFGRSISLKDLSIMLLRFAASHGIDIKEEIIFDHLSVNRGLSLGEEFEYGHNAKSRVVRKISENDEIAGIYPEKNMQWIMKRISFHSFPCGDVVFLHDFREPLTGHFKSIVL